MLGSEEAASRLAAIVESSSDAMIGKTLDGVITSWNAGAQRMYGYAADEILGQSIAVIIPPDLPDELPEMLCRVASGERVEHYETRRVRNDGTVFDVSVTISPIRDRQGAIIGASSVAREITERIQAEAEFRDLQERLHQAQRLESVGQFAGGIAHDFNNLLAGIMNYTALVSDGLVELNERLAFGADGGFVTVTKDVAEIANVANRAARLTQQLLIFSRRQAVKSEVLDLNAIVADLEDLIRRTIGETISLAVDLACDLPRTRGDRGQIEQVLMNLAVNARDAMPDGGTLHVETTAGAAGDPSGYIRLDVSDTGHGMAPEVADRAFEPFFTTKAQGAGTGLGLAIVYGIVTQAGGEVVIHSEVERGTSVRVSPPATPEIVETRVHTAAGKPRRVGGETILLVEDEAMLREPTRRILVRAGYAVLAVSGAEEALRVAAECPWGIALLLTDVVMPGRSGTELAASCNA